MFSLVNELENIKLIKHKKTKQNKKKAPYKTSLTNPIISINAQRANGFSFRMRIKTYCTPLQLVQTNVKNVVQTYCGPCIQRKYVFHVVTLQFNFI